MTLKSIKSIMNQVLAQNKLDSESMSRYEIFLNVLKKYAKQNVEILDFKKDVLYVEVVSAIYANEINIRKKEIIKEINQYSQDKNDNITIRNIKILIKGRG